MPMQGNIYSLRHGLGSFYQAAGHKGEVDLYLEVMVYR